MCKCPSDCMYLCVFSLVSSSSAINSVSKLSQTGKEDKDLSQKAKNPGVGKLTEADKASTGQVGRSLTSSTTSQHTIHHCLSNHSLIPAGFLSPSGEAVCVLGLSESHRSASVFHQSAAVHHSSWAFPLLQLLA